MGKERKLSPVGGRMRWKCLPVRGRELLARLGMRGCSTNRGGPAEGLRGCAAPGPRKRERNPITERKGMRNRVMFN